MFGIGIELMGAALLDDDPFRQRVRFDNEISSCPRGPQKGEGRRPALAVLDGEIESAKTFLFRAIEIVISPIASLFPSAFECIE